MKYKKFISSLLVILLLQVSISLFADTDFQLSFPVDCEINQDCWVVNYVDVEPLPDNPKDFTCGPRSYDSHKGTDIAVKDWQTMVSGIDVYVAADGKVLRIRDGVEDQVLAREQLKRVKQENKACGNGVIIEHGQGWETIYCHLKKGSITVKPNQMVTVGQKLGQIGHSGFVEFPHLHIGVMKDKALIDPYTGLSNQTGCNEIERTLWADKKHQGYTAVSIYASGFSDAVPKFEQIKRDTSSPENLTNDIPALTFWVSIFGVQKGDQIKMEIRDPAGDVFAERDIVQNKTRARQFLYIGKKNKNRSLIKGEYTGLTTLTRSLSSGELLERTIEQKLLLR